MLVFNARRLVGMWAQTHPGAPRPSMADLRVILEELIGKRLAQHRPEDKPLLLGFALQGLYECLISPAIEDALMGDGAEQHDATDATEDAR
jgi:hypothetical protein